MTNRATSSEPISPSVLAAIRSSLAGSFRTSAFASGEGAASPPFITITRATAADHPLLLRQLMTQLNALNPNPPWMSFDRELIEQVARDHGLSEALIHSLENHPHTILEDLLEGLRSDGARPPDQAIYAKVVATIRTLARAGRVVLVGRGGVYCTQDLSGGVHIQLIAPMEYRIRQIMQQQRLNHAGALAILQKADADRNAFLGRFWRGHLQRSDLFTLTINSATVPLEIQVSTIAQIVLARQYQIHVSATSSRIP